QKTKELVDDFTRRGGVQLDVDLDDLRTFDALSKLLRDNGPVLKPWLVARQPASSTKLLRKALSAEVSNGLSADAVAGVERSVDTPSDAGPDGSTSSDVGHHGRTPSDGGHSGSLTSGAGPPAEQQPDVPSISLGAVDGDPLWLTLESLRKHVAVFAGSGSGKTGRLRRLVEGWALVGASSIVVGPKHALAWGRRRRAGADAGGSGGPGRGRGSGGRGMRSGRGATWTTPMSGGGRPGGRAAGR